MAAAVMWTAAVAMALARTFTSTAGLTVWALLLGQAAMVLTGWIIMDRTVVKVYCEAIEAHKKLSDEMVERVASELAGILRNDANRFSGRK